MARDLLRIKTSILEGFDEFLRTRGVDPKSLFDEAELDPDAVGDPTAQASPNDVAMLFERAALKAGDPCLGLAWAEELPVGATGVLAFIVLNENTVRDAVRSIARYASLLLYPVTMEYSEDALRGVISWRWPAELTAPHVQYSSFLVGLMVSRLRTASGETWEPRRVELPLRPLDCAERVRRMLGPNVTYNASGFSVHLDRSVLDLPVKITNPRLKALMTQIGEDMLVEIRSRGDILFDAREGVLTSIERGRVSLEAVAEKLGMPPRTLQSRQASAGTSFEALLSETRALAAQRYLRDTDLTMTEIAFLLGYSELSAFTRAAQRWFGTTPTALRQQLRDGKD